MKVVILFTGVLFMAGCRHQEKKEFSKDASGLEYKIFKQGAGDAPQNGQYLKLQVKQAYNDSVLSDTRTMLPQYQKFDSADMSKESYRIFSQARVGDSLVFKVVSDSAFKTKKPPFVKSNGWLYTYVKVEAILSETEAQADLDLEKAQRGMPREPASPSDREGN